MAKVLVGAVAFFAIAFFYPATSRAGAKYRATMVGSIVNLMFVSSQFYNGASFQGVAGADVACQDAANAASLPGTYKAWLSTDDVSAVEPLRSCNPGVADWSRPDGTPFASTLEELTTSGPQNPPTLDELGQDLSGTEFFGVITGTLSDGGPLPGFNCGNYTDPTAPFFAGDLRSTGNWTANFVIANSKIITISIVSKWITAADRCRAASSSARCFWATAMGVSRGRGTSQ